MHEQDRTLVAGFMPFDLSRSWNVRFLVAPGTTMLEPTRMIVTNTTTPKPQKRPRALIASNPLVPSLGVQNHAETAPSTSVALTATVASVVNESLPANDALSNAIPPQTFDEYLDTEALTPPESEFAPSNESSDDVRSDTAAAQRASKQLKYTHEAVRELEQVTTNVIRQVRMRQTWKQPPVLYKK